MLEILSIFFYRWEGWWKVKGYLAFCSNLVQVWHTVFKIPVGSNDHKGSPVFLKQYNFWQNFSWEVGNNVQPNCCKILVGERSYASAWDAVCSEMWKGCSCWWWRECPAETNWAPVHQCLTQDAAMAPVLTATAAGVPQVTWEIQVLYCLFHLSQCLCVFLRGISSVW